MGAPGTYTPGDGLAFFTTHTGPLDTENVVDGAAWIRNIIAFMNDAAGLQALVQIPIGGILMRTDTDASPDTYLGYGTWSRISGRMLIGAGAADGAISERVLNDTGGEEEHELIEAELAAHAHRLFSVNDAVFYSYCNGWDAGTYGETSVPGKSEGANAYRNTTSSGNPIVEDTGSGTAHNNMPPFLVVSMWKRTA